MGFLNRLNEITKPTVHALEIDLEFGDGPETLHFREIGYLERQEMVKADALYINADLVAASLCDANGKTAATKEAVRKWPAKIVDQLAAAAIKALTPPEESKADPSTGQS